MRITFLYEAFAIVFLFLFLIGVAIGQPRIGGPDAYGYYFAAYENSGAQNFTWDTHTANAIIPTFSYSLDDGYAAVDIGFSFPFYDSSYTQVYICANGYLTFGSGSMNYFFSPNYLPMANEPAAIYFWGRDMHAGLGGTVIRYERKTDPPRLLISYDSLAEFNAPQNRISASIILYENGQIRVLYRSFHGSLPGLQSNAIVAGIQNYHGLNYINLLPRPGWEENEYFPDSNSVVVYSTRVLPGHFSPPDSSTVREDVAFSWSPIFFPDPTSYYAHGIYLSQTRSLVETMSDQAAVGGASFFANPSWRTGYNLLRGRTYFWRIVSTFYDSLGQHDTLSPVMQFQTDSLSPLRGRYSIGFSGTHYTSISGAIHDINRFGIDSGSAVFIVGPGIYHDGPDSLLPTAHTGPNARATFRSFSPTPVRVYKTTTPMARFAYKLDSAGYVSFDGRSSLDNSVGRYITIIPDSNCTEGFVFNSGSDYCNIRNINMVLPTDSRYNPVTIHGNGDTVYNCNIVGGYTGIKIDGEPIANNCYIANTKVSNFLQYGVNIFGTSNTTIKRDTIWCDSLSPVQLCGIYVASSLNTMIDANWIYGLGSNTTLSSSSVYGIYQPLDSDSATMITNNMIDLSLNGTFSPIGMYLGNYCNVLFNTIHLGGHATGNYSSVALKLITNPTIPNNHLVKDNILINQRTGGDSTNTNVCLSFSFDEPTAFSDYNIITTVTEDTNDNRFAVLYGGIRLNTIAQFQQISGYRWDTHSYSMAPVFVSPHNLHIDPNIASPVEGNGTPFAGVRYDFDLQMRDTLHPDIGADEGSFASMAVSEREETLPTVYVLYQNYPNPFNPTTTIRFSLKNRGYTTLTIYNTLGQLVARLAKGNFGAGEHSVRFDATRLGGGIYFYRLESGTFTATRKMVIIK